VSYLLQTLLLLDAFLYLFNWDSVETFGVALGGFFVASISLVYYRVLATAGKPTLLFHLACVLQIVAWLSSLYFALSALLGYYPF
jgi:hypothetical protein